MEWGGGHTNTHKIDVTFRDSGGNSKALMNGDVSGEV